MPNKIDNSTIFDFHHVNFDHGDKTNGSLYICDPAESPAGLVIEETVAAMRDAGIWSTEEARQVADDQREMYKDQLLLTEAVSYCGPDGNFIVARFNHPKFPSDDERWADWLAFFDQKFDRTD